MAYHKINLIGKRFHKLTVIDYEPSQNNQTYWLCKCDCGNLKVVRGDHLRSGNVKSCGCARGDENRKRAKHNLSRSSIYNIYYCMLKRCYNKNNVSYSHYGGRGIEVCEEWKNKENGFDNFYKWACEEGYKKGLSLDRIDVNNNYCPKNCRWATAKQQANNRTNTPHIKFNGASHTPAEWEEITGISRQIILKKYRAGIAPDIIFNCYNQERGR